MDLAKLLDGCINLPLPWHLIFPPGALSGLAGKVYAAGLAIEHLNQCPGNYPRSGSGFNRDGRLLLSGENVIGAKSYQQDKNGSEHH